MTNQPSHDSTGSNQALTQRQVGSFTFDEVGTKVFTDPIGSKTFDESYIITTNQAVHTA